MWSGSLSFGLVNVPVSLHSAVRDQRVRFRQLHANDSSPIQTRRVCAEEGVEVPWEEIARGYEVEEGRWVLLSDDELRMAAPHKSKTIDIEEFVDLEQIDPMFFDHPYLMAPAQDGEGPVRAYALLVEAMRDSGKVALGRLVLRTREQLVAIRAHRDMLMLSTMFFGDEVRPSGEIPGAGEGRKPSAREVQGAVAIIEELSVPFEPERYEDRHRAHLTRLIEGKRHGEQLTPPPPSPPATSAPDLMAVLEESLSQLKGQGGQGAKGAKGVRGAKGAKAAKGAGGAERAEPEPEPEAEPEAEAAGRAGGGERAKTRSRR